MLYLRVFIFGFLLLGYTANAYVPARTAKSQTPIRWKNTTCIFVQINSNGSDDIQDGSDVQAVKDSLTIWRESTQSCSYIDFNLLEDSPDISAEYNAEGENITSIAWVESGWSTELGYDSKATGITIVHIIDYPESDRDGEILNADIELNGTYFHFSTAPDGEKGKTDIQNTVVHELGHVMGLDHPCDDGSHLPIPTDHLGQTIPKCSYSLPASILDATMYNYAAQGEIKKRTPEADDILGICETYPIDEAPSSCRQPGAPIVSGCHIGAPYPTICLPFFVLLGLFIVTRQRKKFSTNKSA